MSDIASNGTTEDGSVRADEPTIDSAHVPVPLGTDSAPKKKGLNHAFRQMRKLLTSSGKHSQDEISTMMKSARGYAGAMGRRADEDAGGVCGLFIPLPAAFAEGGPPAWIPYLPTPGTYEHPRWGKIELSEQRISQFVSNFKSGIYQTQLPLDAEHETKLSGAMAWIRDMRMNSNGSVDAFVEWTDRGKQMLEGNRYKFISPEWFDEWQDPATQVVHRNVAIGGAMTTRPFFKESVLRRLAAREPMVGDHAKHTTPKEFDECPVCGADDDVSEVQEDTNNLMDILADLIEDGLTDEEINQAVGAAVTYGRFMQNVYSKTLGPGAIVPESYTEPGKGATMADTPTTGTTPGTPPEGAQAATITPPVITPVPAIAAVPATFSEADYRKLVEENKTFAERATSAEAHSKQLAERVTTIETASRVKRFTDEVMGRSEDSGIRWFGETEKHVGHLEKLTTAFGEGSDEVKHYIEVNRAATRQVEASEAFRPIGTARSNDGGGSATSKIKTFAEAARAADPKLTEAQAYTKALSEHPDLYTASLKEGN